MNLFEKLLMLPGGRLPVTPDLLPKFAKVIETELKVRNRLAHEKIPQALFVRLAQEASRRVADQSKDKVARNWEMYSEVERIYKNLELIFRGENADDTIRDLIVRFGVNIEAIVSATKRANEDVRS